MRTIFAAIVTLLLCTNFACEQNSESKNSSTDLTEIFVLQREVTSSDSVSNSGFNTEGYDKIVENNFKEVSTEPLSTFSIDVDEASYSNVRRFLNDGMLPPHGAVRIEEMINYFDYNYPQPTGSNPFSLTTEIGDCFWSPKHKLVHVGLMGKTIDYKNLPSSNLVFLVDVSGSMMSNDKLPLVQASLSLLVDQLRENDKVALVVYAGNAGLVLPSTSGKEKQKIKDAIDGLAAGGSTAGGEGIQLAYNVAKENFIIGGNNRVILATDGDFNVGVSSDDELVRLIEKERTKGVFLSVLGFGTGNYQDSKMQQLADNGNGNHSYIDNINEAQKVLIKEFGSTLFTIAKDVKLQVEFNPQKVAAYRLLGYENRLLANEDFEDDTKDAGELGSGHTVTALYEIIPFGVSDSFINVPKPLKYQSSRTIKSGEAEGEWLTIQLRYKLPEGHKTSLLSFPVRHDGKSIDATSANFRFSAAVAEWGLLLRESKFKQGASFDQVIQLASASMEADLNGYRKEFLELVKTSKKLAITGVSEN